MKIYQTWFQLEFGQLQGDHPVRLRLAALISRALRHRNAGDEGTALLLLEQAATLPGGRRMVAALLAMTACERTGQLLSFKIGRDPGTADVTVWPDGRVQGYVDDDIEPFVWSAQLLLASKHGGMIGFDSMWSKVHADDTGMHVFYLLDTLAPLISTR